MEPTNSPPVCCTFRGARSGFVGRLVLYWLLSKPPESLEQLCGFLFMSGLWGACWEVSSERGLEPGLMHGVQNRSVLWSSC